MPQSEKLLFWVGSSKRDLLTFPDDVKDVFGYALHLAQYGEKHICAKPLKGFRGAKTLEIVEDYQGDTFPDDVKDVFGYALHLAQHGEKHARLRDAELLHQELTR